MSITTHCMFALTTILALAANACSASTPRVARTGAAPAQCAGGVIQSEADAARFSGCSAVLGDLQIANSQLEDLSALGSLASVSGSLIISNNPQLSELSGLEALSSVGRLELLGNPELSSVSALSSLHDAPVVHIRNNPKLTSVNGLEGLRQVDQLELVNDGVFETAGFAGLRQVGELTIADNSRLISLRGLNGVTRAASIQIRNNRVLCAQLGFLPQLGEVTDALVLSSNRSVSKREIAGLREHVKGPFQQPNVAGRELALH